MLYNFQRAGDRKYFQKCRKSSFLDSTYIKTFLTNEKVER